MDLIASIINWEFWGMGSIYERTDAWPFFWVAGWFYTHTHTHTHTLRPLTTALATTGNRKTESAFSCFHHLSTFLTSPRFLSFFFLFALEERAAGRQAGCGLCCCRSFSLHVQ
jgi:hypothetical protein